jgi:hypothetical protein
MAITIDGELRSQRRILDDLEHALNDASSLVRRAIRQVKQLSDSASSRHMCYLVLFIFVIFFLLYIMIR